METDAVEKYKEMKEQEMKDPGARCQLWHYS
jgi:hypothetical protein